MAKFRQNDHGSVVLGHPLPDIAAGERSFKLWSTCRRKIIDTMRCGGGMSSRRKTAKSPVPEKLKTSMPECRSEKLSELMKMSESSSEEEVSEEMKRVVKRLLSGENDDVLRGAKEVRELGKEDSEARKTLALLGAIPPLVGILDSGSGDLHSQISSLYALLNLGIGNDMNKAAIVKAGAVHKMLDLVESSRNPDLSAAVVANFLGLSAFDPNKPIIGSSGAILFLIKTLKNLTKSTINAQVIQDSLRALYNLSILPSNILPMIETDDFIEFLFTMIGNTEITDRILLILSNVVSTPEGRKAVSMVHDAFPIMVDVLGWMDSPNCQEKAAYILMVIAHKSYVDRKAMIEAGIKSSLLELTLVGSTLAQKRSSRILEILRIDKGKQISENYGATLSAPLCGSTDSESVDPTKGFQDNNKVKNLVEESLQSNMRRIVKRANLTQDFVPSEHLKKVASFSTTKSLPF